MAWGRRGLVFVIAGLIPGCSSPPIPADPAPSAPVASAAEPRLAPAPPPVVSVAAADKPAPTPNPVGITAAEAEAILFQGGPAPATCAAPDERIVIRCLIEKRFEGQASAQNLALSMWEGSGNVAGIEREYVMDGGFRGTIQIVPELPVRRHERHLMWVAASSTDFEVFFDRLKTRTDKPIHYRHRSIRYKFLRSVNRKTPSAYASDWSIGYNVSGSLHVSVDAVRETLFHEIFHLNDEDHASGTMNWSAKNLGAIHESILQKCGTRIACLTPYAPTETVVRGGTYYAFQPNNGQAVHEYGADLATRYYREQRAMIRGEKLKGRPWKCGPKENAQAWKLMVDEFFGGVDLVGGCG